MFGIILGLSMSVDPLSTPLNAPKSVVEASVIEERILPSWLYELEQNEELYELARCESSLNEKARNPMDSDGLEAKGLFQFKQGTFDAFQEEAGLSGLDIWSGEDQLLLTRWAFANGKQSHWGICL